jgi:hypothetical protein
VGHARRLSDSCRIEDFVTTEHASAELAARCVRHEPQCDLSRT